MPPARRLFEASARSPGDGGDAGRAHAFARSAGHDFSRIPIRAESLQARAEGARFDHLSAPARLRSPCIGEPGQVVQRTIELDYSRVPKAKKTVAESMVAKALEYILRSGTGKTVWADVDESTRKVQVQILTDAYSMTTFSAFGLFGLDKKEAEYKEMVGARRDLMVRWNLRHVDIPDPETSGDWILEQEADTQSAANALLHELGHARQLLNSEMVVDVMRWRKGEHEARAVGDSDLAGIYNLLVEFHNLLHHEIPFSIETGEPVRREYSASSRTLELKAALADLDGRLKREMPSGESSWADVFAHVEKRIAELERAALDLELASRDYSIPSDVDMDEVEAQLEALEDELFGEM